MAIDQISANSLASNPAHVNPQVKADQATSAPQVNQDQEKAAKALKTDTVTISKQAVQMLAKDGDTAVQELKESAAEKASETLRGKK
ncbi:MAG: hypothetical protein WCA04_01955 [Geobacteraceae bacterium]